MKKIILFSLKILSFIIIYSCSNSNINEPAAVKGYDVVSYFNSDTPVKGVETFNTKYNDVTYYFSNKESLNTFLKTPSKYIPQYGGYCAYAVAEKKIKMGVDPKVYEIRDGKLYLFYNSWFANKLKSWQKGDTKKLQKKADKNWEEIKNN